ncbi:Cation transport ATPase [Arcticibacter svalbardensis MN12-7]|uniref:Cation transport ATPase n=1 Tax=Arcticibacter svalbardensis MN12-7 TaxID=1150600 RepID=R9GY80_9SPHI|nr:cation-translocating P-type ATPase [Arcticibacter svalbardensis]EOR93944.1 Cation transport ATPase [Arcticibacter svalbardensis MN12-7]
MEDNIDLKGLSPEEVVASRLKNGSNSAFTENESPFWLIVKDVVTEPLFFILVCAASIYFILGDYKEGIIMLVALLFISAISLFQENRSRNAVDSLKKLSSPHAKVIRAGITTNIDTEELVIGDLIVVEDGNIVPADGKILKSNDFSVNESLLTGESLAIAKDLNEPNNQLFKGSTVMSGSSIARVEIIGKNTALGKIGQSLQEIETTKTPLQIQIKSFIRSMVIFGLIAFLIVWGVNYYTSGNLLNGLLHGLTLAMSVLPEEIPVAFSTFMALGAYHLYKKGVIARSPHTVETLGAATVICADKTGTITENKMQISAIYDFASDKDFDYTKDAYSLNEVLEYALWASETDPFDQMEKSIHHIYGEVAPEDKRKDFVFVHEYPLSGTPPIMTHVLSNKKGTSIIAVKGSVEGVLNQSNLTDEQKAGIVIKTKSYASKGFRVLAVAKSNQDLSNLPKTQQEFEFVFIGLIAFYDPPKANMTKILQQFYQAGISVKMITGDYPDTAISIANQIHFKNSSSVLTGKEVMDMDQTTLCQQVKVVDMYARMFPEAKLKVIEALKSNGEVVAMTGDGVNDGPALKAAHIGIAMGLRGSEVAKSAASLILMDDDLSHMTDAVALGRRIYENLKKAIQYIISIHIPIILIVTLPLLLLWKFTDIFSPIHVIFLELIMGPTCSIVFENEPIEAGSMEKEPRKMSSSFFSFKELSVSIIQGFAITAACLGIGYYFMANDHNETLVRTVIYTTLIFSNLFLTFANRSFYYSIITTIQYKNIFIPIIIGISLIVLFLSIYTPAIRNIFEFEALSGLDLLLCFAVAFAGVLWIELYKLFYTRRQFVKKS